MTNVSNHHFEKDSEITFQTVFENAFFGMVLVGTDGHFMKANQAACDLIWIFTRRIADIDV